MAYGVSVVLELLGIGEKHLTSVWLRDGLVFLVHIVIYVTRAFYVDLSEMGGYTSS